MPLNATRLVQLRRLWQTGEAARIRKDANLTGPEMAEAVGTSATNISRWEKGDRRPRGESAQRYWVILRRLQRVTTHPEEHK